MSITSPHEVTFAKRMLTLALPIVAQNLITALVNMADVVLLSSVGQSAISAVSLAGQITFIVMLFTFSVGTGVGLLTAQYWGKKDHMAIESIVGIGVGLLFLVSVVFFAVSVTMPVLLMSLLTNDVELISLGAQYLRIMSVTYLLMSVSQIYISAVRSMEYTRLTAVISSVSLFLNVALNAVVVFALFPGDIVSAVRGVAVATVLSRSVELVICLFLSSRGKLIGLYIKNIIRFDKPLFKDFIKYTTPAQLNYLVWGGGLTATVAIMGHIDSDMVAANSVVSVVRNLVMVLCTGISQGGSIIVGKSLGAGNLAKAKVDGFGIVMSALIFGVLSGLIILVVRPLTDLFNLTNSAKHILNGMLLISAVYCIGKSLNSTVIGGLFCAGGDAKFGLVCDAITMWCVVIPLGLLAGFYLKVPPLTLYAVLCMDEIVKLPFMVMRYRKYKWLKNITRENTEKNNERGINMNMEERKAAGLLWKDTHDYLEEQQRAKTIMHEFNHLDPNNNHRKAELIKEMFGSVGDMVWVNAPVTYARGKTVSIGNHTYINSNLTLIDDYKVDIGNSVLISPNVTIVTCGHPVHRELRAHGEMYAFAVTIEDCVWIGSNVVLLPGVTIGEGSVIGAGSVVTKDIPENVIAFGNPCRVIREITDEDKKYYYKDREVDAEWKGKMGE